MLLLVAQGVPQQACGCTAFGLVALWRRGDGEGGGRERKRIGGFGQERETRVGSFWERCQTGMVWCQGRPPPPLVRGVCAFACSLSGSGVWGVSGASVTKGNFCGMASRPTSWVKDQPQQGSISGFEFERESAMAFNRRRGHVPAWGSLASANQRAPVPPFRAPARLRVVHPHPHRPVPAPAARLHLLVSRF